MFDKLEDLLIRFEEIMGELNEPTVTNNQERFRSLMKEQSDLTPIVEAYKEYKACKQDIEDSSPALEVAEENAERLLSGRTGVSARFLQSDLFEAVDGKYDILVSNPPYIRSAVVDTLMPEVKDYEPRIALDGEEDGLVFYRRILSDCKKNLKKGGMLFFEIGYDQAEAVKGMMEQAGFLEVTVKKDFGGLDRVVFGTLGFGAL